MYDIPSTGLSIEDGDGATRTDAPPVRVLKFGGSSLCTPSLLRRVARIIQDVTRHRRVVVVVSACAGTTDTLVEAWPEAAPVPRAPRRCLTALYRFHASLSRAVLPPALHRSYLDRIRSTLDELKRGIEKNTGRLSPEAQRDAWLATGERLATPLLAALLCANGLEAGPHDASPLLRTDDCFGNATICYPESRQRLLDWYATLPRQQVPVVTGFIGATHSGVTTTLGRGGTDYTAAVIAAALRAEALERWTDVDGLYTADPRVDPSARRFEHLPLEEAFQLHQAQGLGMHPRIFEPLRTAGVPLIVRATTRPGPGTYVYPSGLTGT